MIGLLGIEQAVMSSDYIGMVSKIHHDLGLGFPVFEPIEDLDCVLLSSFVFASKYCSLSPLLKLS